MRIRIAVVAAACAAVAIVPSAASAHGTHLKAKMTGEQVVPTGEGAPSGEGKARVHLLKSKQKLKFRVAWSGIGTTKDLNAGIYSGETGENGDEVVALVPKVTENDFIKGSVSVPKRTLRKLNRNPHLYHVNLKTKKYPTYGAIRGQLKS